MRSRAYTISILTCIHLVFTAILFTRAYAVWGGTNQISFLLGFVEVVRSINLFTSSDVVDTTVLKNGLTLGLDFGSCLFRILLRGWLWVSGYAYSSSHTVLFLKLTTFQSRLTYRCPRMFVYYRQWFGMGHAAYPGSLRELCASFYLTMDLFISWNLLDSMFRLQWLSYSCFPSLCYTRERQRTVRKYLASSSNDDVLFTALVVLAHEVLQHQGSRSRNILLVMAQDGTKAFHCSEMFLKCNCNPLVSRDWIFCVFARYVAPRRI